MTGPNRHVVVGQLNIREVNNIGHPSEFGRLVRRQPSSQKPLNGRSIRVERHKMEPPPESRVDEGDASIGGIHCSDYPEVLRKAECVAGVKERKSFISIFEQVVQLTEYLCHIPTIDFVDQQHRDGSVVPRQGAMRIRADVIAEVSR